MSNAPRLAGFTAPAFLRAALASSSLCVVAATIPACRKAEPAPIAGLPAPQTSPSAASHADAPSSFAVAHEASRRVAIEGLAPAELARRVHDDASSFARIVASVQRAHAQIDAAHGLFDRAAEAALSADERDESLALFGVVLDHIVALDAMSRFHFASWRAQPGKPEQQAPHFDVAFAAYVEKLALGFALVERAQGKPQFEKLFDEGSAGAGIAPGAWARLKWNVVHVEDVARVLAAHQVLKLLSPQNERLKKERPYAFVLERLEERYARIEERLRARGVQLFAGNGVDIAKDLGHDAWFPVQAETAEWMGDTKVHRLDDMLITLPQVREAIARSEPGDIIVERRNWYLSNIGLPGFWPHAALWIGSPDEVAAWARDPAIEQHYGGPFLAALRARFPDAVRAWQQPDAEGNPRRLLEAISEGVMFNAAEESIRADYVAAMRPQRDKLTKARAIERAFSYAGRPYDFDFDFYTDASLVCSELVYKAWEPRDGVAGIALPLEKVVGRMAIGPNAIVRQFDLRHDQPDAPLRFAWFLDGQERTHTAAFADEAAFRASWRRPKWDVAQR